MNKMRPADRRTGQTGFVAKTGGVMNCLDNNLKPLNYQADFSCLSITSARIAATLNNVDSAVSLIYAATIAQTAVCIYLVLS